MNCPILHQHQAAMKSEKSEDRILISTWPTKIWATEKMKCESCKECWRDPRSRNRCIYGGPFVFGGSDSAPIDGGSDE